MAHGLSRPARPKIRRYCFEKFETLPGPHQEPEVRSVFPPVIGQVRPRIRLRHRWRFMLSLLHGPDDPSQAGNLGKPCHVQADIRIYSASFLLGTQVDAVTVALSLSQTGWFWRQLRRDVLRLSITPNAIYLQFAHHVRCARQT